MWYFDRQHGLLVKENKVNPKRTFLKKDMTFSLKSKRAFENS